MNPNILALIIIAAVLLLIVPVIASLIVCVPKWWREVVDPYLPDIGLSLPSRWYFAPFRWVLAVLRFTFILLLAFPAFFTVGLIVKYCYSWGVWIERKCPYTTRFDIEVWDSKTKGKQAWDRDWEGTFGDLWSVAVRGSK